MPRPILSPGYARRRFSADIGFLLNIRTLLAVLFGFAGTVLPVVAESFYDRHVVFDNSPADGSYYQSQGMATAPSKLEMLDYKLPVETNHFQSPPNSLRLKWTSALGGDWQMKIKSAERYGRNLVFEGDTISLWCYSEQGLSAAESPRIALQDRNDVGSPAISLLADIGSLPAGKWVRISIPFSRFRALFEHTHDEVFNPAKLSKIWLLQGMEDAREHVLYIDDIQVYYQERADSRPPVTPAGLQVRPGERHFDLMWSNNAESNVLTYRIYRSWDGKNFSAVGTQRGQFNRFVDFVGPPPREAWYRISAMDISGNESALSDAVSAKTRAFGDDELLDMVQEACFRYYWEGANANSGMALEIIPGDDNLVAVGASGFGIMALLAGAERHFITREQCAERLLKITRFLARADRFHGAWPHFLDGATGKVIAYFGKYDDGGDLVETSFLVQGLLAARQYFGRDTEEEKEIRQNVTDLWHGVEWDWYRKEPDSDFLYWHWSPDYGWHIRHPLVGWNETMMAYLLAIASPTHPVPAGMYYSGWAGQSAFAVQYRQNWSRTTLGSHYTNGSSFYGFKLDVGEGNGADLFFTQFSFMGFDPRGIHDKYADYFHNNRNIALINHAYCTENPRHYAGYSAECWGLSAGIKSGGGRPLARDDNGTICCSAGVGSFAYTPEESMAALKHFYRDLGGKIWGIYGFHDGFNQTENWFDPVWMGLNQAVIVNMIENQRSGLLWKCFMANPEIRPALDAIGFQPNAAVDSH